MADAWDGFRSVPYHRPPVRPFKKVFDRTAKMLGSRRVWPYGIDDWYDFNVSRHLAEIRDEVRPDAVILEYVFLSKALEVFGNDTLKMIDTHDVFGNRHELYRKNGMIPQWFYTTPAMEGKALDRADVVIAIQASEADYFSSITYREVITVGHVVQAPAPPAGPGDEKEGRLLFVGSANPINVDGLRWFIDEVFPRVREEVPGAELEVVGKVAGHITPIEGIILTGPVPDLALHYRRAGVAVNPLRFGTGLKIKTIEALSHGRPLVTLPAGAMGLEEWAGRAFRLAGTAEEFAGQVSQLLKDEGARRELTERAADLVRRYNSATLQPIMNLLEG